MNKAIIDELHQMLDAPFKEFMGAAKRYDESPSIPNGAMKQEAREKLYDALRAAAERALEKWHLPPDEFNEIVDGMGIAI